MASSISIEKRLFHLHAVVEQAVAQRANRIEVVRGPGSAVYGADAFAGTINIITKEPDALLEQAEERRQLRHVIDARRSLDHPAELGGVDVASELVAELDSDVGLVRRLVLREARVAVDPH